MIILLIYSSLLIKIGHFQHTENNSIAESRAEVYCRLFINHQKVVAQYSSLNRYGSNMLSQQCQHRNCYLFVCVFTCSLRSDRNEIMCVISFSHRHAHAHVNIKHMHCTRCVMKSLCFLSNIMQKSFVFYLIPHTWSELSLQLASSSLVISFHLCIFFHPLWLKSNASGQWAMSCCFYWSTTRGVWTTYLFL